MKSQPSISKDETTKLLDELFSQNDSSKTTLDILKFTADHKANALKTHGDFVLYFEDLFNELNLSLQLLNGVSRNDWKTHKRLQNLLLPEAMKSLHRAFEDTISGYHDESVILNRSVYETFLRIVFLSCYPDDHYSIIEQKEGKTAFIVTNFVKENLRLDWEWLYKLMSIISHSKKHRLLKAVTTPMEGNGVYLDYSWDEDGMRIARNIIMFNLACLHHALVSIFCCDLPQEHMERINKVDRVLLGIIAANPKEDYSRLHFDIQKVGSVVKSADAGEDWKAMANGTD